MARFVVLLRAVNVGKRQAPMAQLREACGAAGFADVATYIQSGNLVLTSDGVAPEVEARLERLVQDRFGFFAQAIARTAAQWSAYAAGSAFPEMQEQRPNQLLLCVSKRPLRADAVETLLARASFGERVAATEGGLWVDFAGGVGASQLTPAWLDKAAGSAVTARNWNTVLKLQAMASADG